MRALVHCHDVANFRGAVLEAPAVGGRHLERALHALAGVHYLAVLHLKQAGVNVSFYLPFGYVHDVLAQLDVERLLARDRKVVLAHGVVFAHEADALVVQRYLIGMSGNETRLIFRFIRPLHHRRKDRDGISAVAVILDVDDVFLVVQIAGVHGGDKFLHLLRRHGCVAAFDNDGERRFHIGRRRRARRVVYRGLIEHAARITAGFIAAARLVAAARRPGRGHRTLLAVLILVLLRLVGVLLGPHVHQVLVDAHQQRGHFRARELPLGVEAAVAAALEHAALPHQLHGLARIVGDGVVVRGQAVRHGRRGVHAQVFQQPHEEQGHLRPRHGVVGRKKPLAHAKGDAALHGPGHIGLIPAARLHVREAAAAAVVVRVYLRHAPQHGDHHRAGHAAVGLKRAVGRAVEYAAANDIVHRVAEPVAVANVPEALLAPGAEGRNGQHRHNDGQSHHDGQQPLSRPFIHPYTLLSGSFTQSRAVRAAFHGNYNIKPFPAALSSASDTRRLRHAAAPPLPRGGITGIMFAKGKRGVGREEKSPALLLRGGIFAAVRGRSAVFTAIREF